jgi:ABC-2 type transport system permease protein
MTALVSAELLKLRTTRTAWVTLAAVTLLSVLFAFALVTLSGTQGNPPLDAMAMEYMLRGPGKIIGGAMALLGLLGAAGEFRHRTAVPTFLGEPRRQRVLAAKLLAYGLAAVAFALVVLGVTVAAGIPMLLADGVPVRLLASGPLLAVVGVVGVAVLYGVLGVALGALFRNQTVALGAGLVWAFVIEGGIPLVTREPDIVHWLPTGAADAVLRAGHHVSGALPAWGAAGLLAAYAAVLAAGGWALLKARDV